MILNEQAYRITKNKLQLVNERTDPNAGKFNSVSTKGSCLLPAFVLELMVLLRAGEMVPLVKHLWSKQSREALGKNRDLGSQLQVSERSC